MTPRRVRTASAVLLTIGVKQSANNRGTIGVEQSGEQSGTIGVRLALPVRCSPETRTHHGHGGHEAMGGTGAGAGVRSCMNAFPVAEEMGLPSCLGGSRIGCIWPPDSHGFAFPRMPRSFPASSSYPSPPRSLNFSTWASRSSARWPYSWALRASISVLTFFSASSASRAFSDEGPDLSTTSSKRSPDAA